MESEIYSLKVENESLKTVHNKQTIVMNDLQTENANLKMQVKINDDTTNNTAAKVTYISLVYYLALKKTVRQSCLICAKINSDYSVFTLMRVILTEPTGLAE